MSFSFSIKLKYSLQAPLYLSTQQTMGAVGQAAALRSLFTPSDCERRASARVCVCGLPYLGVCLPLCAFSEVQWHGSHPGGVGRRCARWEVVENEEKEWLSSDLNGSPSGMPKQLCVG